MLLKLFEDIEMNITLLHDVPSLENITIQLDKCILLINHFIMINNDFIFIHKLRELFEKIKINLTLELFNNLYKMIRLFTFRLSSLNKSLISFVFINLYYFINRRWIKQ